MAASAKYTLSYRDELSDQLRRTPDDYGDIRDTFEKIEGYTPGANPGRSYSGWVKGKSLYRVGTTAILRNHDLISLHHWVHNPKLKNFSYLYYFKPSVTRPYPEDTEYLAQHHRRRGYLPSSVPFSSSYAGFTPLMDDLEQRTQHARVEGLAKCLRRVDKRREELIHTLNRVRGTYGNYIFPIPELAEREYTWGYLVPLKLKGEHHYSKPLPDDFQHPDQSKLRGRIDVVGYGGYMPNLVGKFGKSHTHHQKQGMQEFKLNYFSNLSDLWSPSLCTRSVKAKKILDDSYVVQEEQDRKQTGIDWVNNCPYKIPELVLSDKEKEIRRQKKLRPSLQDRKGCSRSPTLKEVYDKVLYEKCPSQFKRNPKFQLPSGYKFYD